MKGWLGFGDRLETLKMAVDYCQRMNVKLYVDWSDSMWSHGSENFYTYFKLINVPQINSLHEIPSDATIYPAFWKDRLHEPLSKDITDKGKDTGIDIGQLKGTYEYDVVVLSNVCSRTLYLDSSFFAKSFRVVDRRIIKKVKERQSKYNLSSALGVHIRGSDRVKDSTRDKTIQWLTTTVSMVGGLSGKQIVVVSDDKKSLLVWKRFYPGSTILSELSIEQSSVEGNHNLSKEKLKFTKDEMNVDCLIDFFTLASTERIYSTAKDSRFAQEAKRLRPFVNMMLAE